MHSTQDQAALSIARAPPAYQQMAIAIHPQFVTTLGS
jgi:hypothetical protein